LRSAFTDVQLISEARHADGVVNVELGIRTLLIGALVVGALAVAAMHTLKRWHAAWQRRSRWSRANQAETRAALWLRQLGYEVLGAQVEGTYVLAVDGIETAVLLRADYLVARHGLTYVAEVKSGNAAPKLSTAATRRQLLEYLLAFGVDGVLLVDGETRRVHEIVFSIAQRGTQPRPCQSAAPYALCASVLVIALILYRYAH
jgi:hypothetical protein